MKLWWKVAMCVAVLIGTRVLAQSQPITLVTPYPPGGAADQLARVIAQEMEVRHGETIIVENRPGAAGQVAMNAVKNWSSSSRTVLFLADIGAYSINRHLYKTLSYSVATDLLPLTLVAKAPVFLLVNKESPFRSVQDMVQAAKSQNLMYGSPGVGTGTHLLGEMLRKESGAHLTHVPYRGAGPALVDAVSGQLDFIFDVLIGSRGYLDEGRLRTIAVAGTQRSSLRPDVPTIAESGIENVALTLWWGISARAGTEPEIAARLAAQIADILKDRAVIEKFSGLGIEIEPSSPEEFAALIEHDARTLGAIVDSLDIELE